MDTTLEEMRNPMSLEPNRERVVFLMDQSFGDCINSEDQLWQMMPIHRDGNEVNGSIVYEEAGTD